MAYIIFSIFLGVLLNILHQVGGDTYSVKIGTDKHVNVIDSKFLSFTIDPKYLFSSSEKYRSKECICMASSLTPAYIRIAGPSTAFLSFYNATITIEDVDELPQPVQFHESFADDLAKEIKKKKKGRVGNGDVETFENRFKRNHERIEVSHKEWRKFVQWAKATGFELVFALNNEEKVASGMWDPNTALNILTVAEKANIGDIYWQLGYECQNQSIEEYLNDLETLGVITETFTPGRAGQWKVVGGDVTPCLQADSKSDFKDYVTLSNDMMDAILLNGDSSTQELERMSERDRVKLLKILNHSDTPLWLTDTPWSQSMDEVSQAADWLAGLGRAAKNGYSNHFRELADEMDQPSLSFYMALLFKNLVGSKVLNVDMEPDQAVMFAHCTSLRQQVIPGAVTLYAVNMDVEPARFSVKMDRREEGGDIMQFILGHDSSGNIQVNGKPMYFEGDLKPVVKRVRPYKTLLLKLPARSFGFWVLANTKINACYDEDSTDKEYVEAETVESTENDAFKAKRSVLHKDFDDNTDQAEVSVDFFDDTDTVEYVSDKNLVSKLEDLNQDLNKAQELYKNLPSEKRLKRQIDIESLKEKIKSKLRNRGLVLRKNNKTEDNKTNSKIPNVLRLSKRNMTRRFRKERNLRKISNLPTNKVSKRNPKVTKTQEYVAKVKLSKATEKPEFLIKPELSKTTEHSNEITEIETKSRQCRSTDKDEVELTIENEIDTPKDNEKLWQILRKIHTQLKDLSEENDDYIEEDNSTPHHHHDDSKKDDSFKEHETGFIKTTVGNLMKTLSDLNKNLNRFWTGIKLLD